ncbi:MAG: GntR family transcriptional regulator [Acidimicrobiia bacterium]
MATVFKVDLPEAPAALRGANPRLHDLAYAHLKGLLLDGGLDPGDRISSEGVGRALSISRAPVGDAIRRLTMDGLLEVLPQVGVQVVTPVPGEVADFYELFAATEAVIGRLAAARRTPAEATALRQLLGNLASRADLPDDADARAAELRQRNRRRYERLHELARSPLSTGIGESFWDRSDFFLRVAFGRFQTPRYVAGSYRLVFDAVVDGDAAIAEHEIRQYLTRLGGDVAEALAARTTTR